MNILSILLPYINYIKAGLIVLCVIIITGSVLYWKHGIYEDGRIYERSIWLEEQEKQRVELAKEMDEAIGRVSQQNEAHRINTMRVIDEKDIAISKLDNDLAYANRVRVSTKNTACNANTVPGQTDSTGIADKSSGESGIRIAIGNDQEIYATEEQVGEMITALNHEKEALKVHFKAVAGTLVPLVNVVR